MVRLSKKPLRVKDVVVREDSAVLSSGLPRDLAVLERVEEVVRLSFVSSRFEITGRHV
jgi:hypothetical protein